MKHLLFSLFLLFFSHSLWAEQCKLRGPLFSLSGTTTVVLKELDLLNDSNLKGISIFNPIPKHSFKGERLGGGLFLSRREDKVFGNADVIYDQGRELDRYFKEREYPSTGINTVGLTPKEASLKGLALIESRVLGCETELGKLKNKIENLSQVGFKNQKKIVFFLGKISKGPKFPEMVYGQDGFVLELTKTGKIKTYPSELHYIRWSQKILNSLSSDFLFIGLQEPKNQTEKKIEKITDKHLNIIFPGALTPGVSQLELIQFLVDHL